MGHMFFLNDFKETLLKEKAELTVFAYLTDLKQFFIFYKGGLDALTTKDVEDWKLKLLGKRLKPKTVNRKLVSLKRFIDYLNNCPEYGKKILAEIKLFKIQRQEYLEDVLENSDLNRIIKAAEASRDVVFVGVVFGMFYTGARVSEILQLKVNDIDREYVSIRGKGGKVRDLFIPNKLRDYLAPCVAGRSSPDGGAPLFLNKKGKPLDRQTVHSWIKKYAGMSRVKLSVAHAHSLRHLFCYDLIDNGCSLDDVANLAGHSDINTTRIYTKKTKRQLLKTINNLNSKRRTE